MNRENSAQFTFFMFVLVLFVCIFVGTSYFLYNGFLLQASMLDLLTLTRINALRKLVTIIFFTVWFVSCWTNLYETEDTMRKNKFNLFTFLLWSAFCVLLFKIHYDFARSIRPVFGAVVTYQFSEYLQRVGLFSIGISLFCYQLSFWLAKIITMIFSYERQ